MASPNYPAIIFVRPQASGNIGALSRAMSNFGPTELRLVGSGAALHTSTPDDPFSKMDWALAKKGEGILKNSKWFPDLRTALEDCHLSIGTSGRSIEFERGYARPIIDPSRAFDEVLSTAEKAGEGFKWALVFGPEDDGLNDHEAALCQKLIRIPTADKNPSLNLAMAAGLLMFLFFQKTLPVMEPESTFQSGAFLEPERSFKRLPHTESGREEWATLGEREIFLDYLMDTVSHTQFLKYPDQDSVRARIRRWLQNALIPRGELLFAFEILYNLKAWGTGKFEARDFLKSRR